MPRRFPLSPFRKGDTAMMKDVWISISNLQNDGREKDSSTMVFDTAGYYFFDDGVGVLSYQESELTGLEGTRTSVMVMPALGPSLGVAPSGTWMCRSCFSSASATSAEVTEPYSRPFSPHLTSSVITFPFRESAFCFISVSRREPRAAFIRSAPSGWST